MHDEGLTSLSCKFVRFIVRKLWMNPQLFGVECLGQVVVSLVNVLVRPVAALCQWKSSTDAVSSGQAQISLRIHLRLGYR